jgi:predicted outer membrane protein
MKKFSTGCAIAMLSAACSLAAAQDSSDKNVEKGAEQRNNRQQNRAENAQRDEHKPKTLADKMVTDYFAGKMMLMDQSTIELAKLAEQHSSNPQVKEFAKMLVDEHTKCHQKLQECAPDVVGVTNLKTTTVHQTAGFRGTTDADDQNKEDAIDNPAKAAKNPARKPDGSEQIVGNGPVDPDGVDRHKRMHGVAMTPVHQILAIDRQATDNYIQSTTEMLQKYEGQDFDMGFLGFTIGSHTWAVAELKAMDSVGDEKFQKLISDATTKTEQHLMKAQELSEGLEKDLAGFGEVVRPEQSVEKAPVPK